MALRNCSASHCGSIDVELNEVCKQEGWAVGHPVITRDEKGPCQCHCSCLALDTPLAASEGKYIPIQSFRVGDMVWATGPDLNFKEFEVKYSNGTIGDAEQPYSIFLEYEDGFLIVTADHLFFMPNGKLKRADKLCISDELISPEGDRVEIKIVSMGTFFGGFHHIATSTDDPKGDLNGHLLDTNGVVSADYAVQLFYKEWTGKTGLFVDDHDELPILGTPEYKEKYGVLIEPETGQTKGNVKIAGGTLSRGNGKKVFVPMGAAGIDIPEDAVSFISKKEAEELAKYPRRPFTDPDAQAWTEYLLTQYKAFYPNVEFAVDWYNDEVNAYAYRQGGIGHVVLLGGLIRFPAIEVEGLALVIAHEIGHLIGGPPFYPATDLSCEGQADYYGVRNVMRVVWFGSYYYDVTVKSIRQMSEFFGLPPFTTADSKMTLAGCGHPPGPCRIETYNAALDLQQKPDCAG